MRALGSVFIYGLVFLGLLGGNLFAAPPVVTGTTSTTLISANQVGVQVFSVAAGTSSAAVSFEYGPTTSYGSQKAVTTVNANSTGYYLETLLSSLSPGTTYHYRAKATNADGTTYGPDATFTTYPLPVLAMQAPTGVTDIAAVFNATANPGGSGLTMDFQYGTSPTSLSSTVSPTSSYVTGTSTVPVTASVSGLLPNTTYYYRLRVVDNSGSSFFTSPSSLTTAPATSPPAVSGALTVSSISATSANLQVTSVNAGGSAATYFFEYGPTTAYGTQTPAAILAASTTKSVPSTSLLNLTPGITYHCRFTATNAQGTTSSADATFATLPAPVITTETPTPVTDLSAVFKGTANAKGGSFSLTFDYGTSSGYGSTASAQPSSASGSNTTAVTSNAISLPPNTLYHYRLRATDNRSGVVYAGSDTVFTTAPAATPPTLGTVSAYSTTIQSTGLQVTSVAAKSSNATVYFEYGLTTAYGSQAWSFPSIAQGNTATASATVTGLSPSTTYHYRATAVNAQGSVSSADATFTTPGIPSVTTGAASGITDITAVVNGVVTPAGGSLGTVVFDYGLTTSYGSTGYPSSTSASGSSPVGKSANLSSLTPNTLYHYRLRGTDDAGSIYYGEDQTFTTTAGVVPPSLGVAAATAFPTSAVLEVANVAAGSAPTTVVFEYGLTTAYGLQKAYGSTYAINSTGGNPYVTVTGLTPSTTYHFRAKATSTLGTATTADVVFTTLAEPIVTTGAMTGVTDLGATFNGVIDANGQSVQASFEYGLTTSYGGTIYPSSSSSVYWDPVNFTVTTNSLQPDTTYHYRLRGQFSPSGLYYYGADQTFTTSASVTPPSLNSLATTDVNTTSTSLRLSSASAGGAPATLVFEYGPTTVYGTQVAYSTVIAANSTVSYPTVQVTGLTPGTTYHYRARATSTLGTATTADGTFTTIALPVLVTNPATGVTDLTAIFSGTVNANGNVFWPSFEYGTTTAYGSTISTSSGSYTDATVPVAYTANPTGLVAGTTYHYRIRGYFGSFYSNYFYGEDQTFTMAAGATLPRLGANTASSVTATTATFNANNVFAGSSAATVVFEYGLTTAYGAQAPASNGIPTNSSSSVSAAITGLVPNSTYHFRVRATNAQGTIYSEDLVFNTRPAAVVTTEPATGITDLAATFNGTANAGGGSLTVTFEYGTSLSYGSTQAAQASTITSSTPVALQGKPAGLLPSTTYYYRLRGTDSAGVVSYGAAASFTTAAPASPPALGQPSVPALSASTATVWVSNIVAGSSTTTVRFEYGLTAAYGAQKLSAMFQPSTTVSSASVSLSGLTPATLYHFRAIATNSQGSVSTVDSTFTTLPLPTVTTSAATDVTDLTATLNGSINPRGGSMSSVAFDYGPTTAYGFTASLSSTISGTTAVAQSVALGSLQPNTTYHYRLRAKDAANVSYTGADAVFTTAPAATLPVLSSLNYSSLSSTTATLSASVAAGSSAATTTFEYGLTTAYGAQVVTSPVALNTSSYRGTDLRGLLPGTTYHFRVVATNGQGSVSSGDLTFTTKGVPSVITLPATGVTDFAATLNGLLNTNGTSTTYSFEYGTTLNYESTLSGNTYYVSTTPTALSGKLTNLQPGTLYHYRLKVYDQYTTLYHYGADQTFTTAPASTPPSIGAISSSSVTASRATLTASTIAAGSSPAALLFQYGPTTAYGAQTYYSSLLAAGTTTSSASVNLTGLQPATTYHYRVVVTNGQGSANSADATFTTPALPTVTTLAASAVTDVSAVFNGMANGGGASLSVTFQYGTTTSYGSSASATVSSVSGTSDVALTSNPVSLLPSTTYHYRLWGTSGGVDYVGADMTFTTSAGGSLPSVQTGAVSSIKSTSANFSTGSSVSAGSSSATLAFEYGLTTTYGSEIIHPSVAQVYPTLYSRDMDVTGLSPGTTYHVRARITNSLGTTYGADRTFTTLPAPLVITELAGNVADQTATLNGTAIPASGVNYTVAFEYGLTTAYGATIGTDASSISGNTATSVASSLQNLLPNTTYHYRLRLSDGFTSYYGADATLATLAAATPPSAITAPATLVKSTTAVLQATAVKSGSSPATVSFEYGLTTAYGTVAPVLTHATSHTYATLSQPVEGLQPATTYHYRVTTTNAQGTFVGQDMTFTTSDGPSAVTTAAFSVTDVSASLRGLVNPAGFASTLTFEYGPTSLYGLVATSSLEGAYVAPIAVSLSVSRLLPDTTYHYRVRLDNPLGTFYGDDLTFTTAGAATSLPTVTASSVSAIGGDAARVYATVNAGTSPASAIIEFGLSTGYGSQVAYANTIDARSSDNFNVLLGGLQPSTTYHARVRATNSEGSVAGPDMVFTTSAVVPVVTTGPATSVSDLAATLNGAVTGGWQSLTLRFEYGKTTAYGSTATASPSSLTSPNSVAPTATLSSLSPNTLYHYRLNAIDSSLGLTYSGQDMTFTTGPSITPPSISTGSTQPNGAKSVYLYATNVSSGSAQATISWEYGLTTAYGSEAVYGTYNAGASASSLSKSVSGLAPNTTYHYRAKITTALATVTGNDAVFSTPAPSLSATTLAATSVRAASATLNGNFLADADTSTLSFEWGLTTSYGSTLAGTPATAVASTSTRSVSASLSDLEAATTYHYRFVLANPNGTIYGSDQTLTTAPAAAPNAPIVTTGDATGSLEGNATFRGTVNGNGSPTTVYIEYGLTTNYTAASSTLPSAVSGNQGVAVAASVTGLTTGTQSPYPVYHYRVVATNSFGTTYGDDATVTMIRPPMLTLQTPTATPTSAALGAYSSGGDAVTSAYYEYGPTTAYGTVLKLTPSFGLYAIAGGVDVYNGGTTTPLLTPGVTYHYRLVAANSGGTVITPDATFVADYPAPAFTVQAATGLTPTGVTLNVDVREYGNSTDVLSFEYGLTPELGSAAPVVPGTVSGPPTGSASVTPVSVTLAGLTPGMKYYYRFKGTRTTGGNTFVTASAYQIFALLSPLQNWRKENFGSTTNQGLSADNAMPAGDGLSNLLKYALNLDPWTPTVLPNTSEVADYNGTSYLGYVFTRDPLKTDLTYIVQAASSPAGPWTSIASSIAGAATTGPGFVSETSGANGQIIVEVHDTVPSAGNPARYLRLQISH